MITNQKQFFMNEMTFARQILQFNHKLMYESLTLPDGFKIINPFKGAEKETVRKITTAFYQKYYDDCHTRRLILGSSPARRGSALTGVPFEDLKHIQKETGIFIDRYCINQSSSGFLYEVMRKYGGRKKIYTDFYMNFVCPIGIVRTNSKGNEVNCNYYESKTLQEALRSFIVDAIRSQIDFGIDTSVCVCIGSGGNYSFLSKLNDEYCFFNKIIPLEHPRFIMQYNSKRKEMFIEKYVDALCS